MKKIGIFYSYSSTKTAKISEKIMDAFDSDDIESIDAENVTSDDFSKYDNIIAGVPTWFDGELPIYWDEFVPAIEEMDLTGKKVAIYGLGDQKGYPENFNDGVGLFSQLVSSRGATVVGCTSTEGYEFEGSKALKDNQFTGLCLDQENQARLSQQRISNWVTQLKSEFD